MRFSVRGCCKTSVADNVWSTDRNNHLLHVQRHGGILHPRAGCQSAGVFVVLTQPACIDQWTRRPLAETANHSGRSKPPAKVLRTERARLERNKPLRYSAGVAPSHLGANGVKPEHLSPPEISRRLSTGGAVIEMKPCTTVVEAPNLPKNSIIVAPQQHAGQVGKDGVRGRKPLVLLFPRLPRGTKKNHTLRYDCLA